MKSTNILVQEHEILLHALDILDVMIKRLEDGQRIEIADANAILTFLRVVGEEPALVAGLEDALRTKRAMDFVRDSRRLILILRNNASNQTAETEPANDRKQQEIHAGVFRLERKYTPGQQGKPLGAIGRF